MGQKKKIIGNIFGSFTLSCLIEL